jgi:hypothetical protein
MAAGFPRHLAGDAVEVRSAGSAPADQVNPVAVQAMREVGIAGAFWWGFALPFGPVFALPEIALILLNWRSLR